MVDNESRRDRFFFSNNLVGVAKGLEGQYTTIDLRNESSVTGKIKYVDGFMNIELEDCVFFDQRGFEHIFERYAVRARLIRYIHIPKNLDAVQILKGVLDKLRVGKKTKKVSTFKTRRAQRYQKEIIAGISGSLQEDTKEALQEDTKEEM